MPFGSAPVQALRRGLPALPGARRASRAQRVSRLRHGACGARCEPGRVSRRDRRHRGRIGQREVEPYEVPVLRRTGDGRRRARAAVRRRQGEPAFPVVPAKEARAQHRAGHGVPEPVPGAAYGLLVAFQHRRADDRCRGAPRGHHAIARRRAALPGEHSRFAHEGRAAAVFRRHAAARADSQGAFQQSAHSAARRGDHRSGPFGAGRGARFDTADQARLRREHAGGEP